MRNILLLVFVLFFSLALTCGYTVTEGSKVVGMKAFKATNSSVLFSWQVETSQHGWKQLAYKVQVANSVEYLKNSEKLVWNSGKIESEQSNLVPAAGIVLKPAQTYYWRVKLWNSQNTETDWSEPAVLKTGLVSETDWQGAQWIGYEDMPANKRMVPGCTEMAINLENYVLTGLWCRYLEKNLLLEKKLRKQLYMLQDLGNMRLRLMGRK